MDQFWSIYGMKIQVQGHLPPGSMLIVSPDVMHKMLMDPRFHQYGFLQRPDPPIRPDHRFFRASDLSLSLKVAQDYDPLPYRTMSLFELLADEGVDGLQETLVDEYQHELHLLQRLSHRRARFHAFLWERQWWHEGRQKGWWES